MPTMPVGPDFIARSTGAARLADPGSLPFQRDCSDGRHARRRVPALANRWLRALAVRRLWSDGLLQRPDMMHVVDDEMVDLALALSEDDRLPYVQTVAGFGSVERGLRLSRRWCRRLVATSPDLAEAMTQGIGDSPPIGSR